MTLAPSPIPELDDAEWDMISRGDMLGSRLGAKTATTITTLLARADKLAAALEGHERTLAFIARWAWREGNLTDAERLSSIKYHPTIKAIADPAHSALAEGVAKWVR